MGNDIDSSSDNIFTDELFNKDESENLNTRNVTANKERLIRQETM